MHKKFLFYQIDVITDAQTYRHAYTYFHAHTTIITTSASLSTTLSRAIDALAHRKHQTTRTQKKIAKEKKAKAELQIHKSSMGDV